MTRTMLRQEEGFTLVELLVSTAIMMTVTAGVFTVMKRELASYFATPMCNSVCAWASIR